MLGAQTGYGLNIGNLFAVVQSEVTEGTEDADQSAMALVWQDGLRVIMPSGNRYDGEAKPGESPDALVARATGMIGLYARLEGRTHDPGIVVHRVPEGLNAEQVDEWMRTLPNLEIAVHHPSGQTVVYENREHVGRNDPCPCELGKKYKRCCGDPARQN